MNRKKAVKKILSHFNVKIPVKYSPFGYSLALDTRNNTFHYLFVQNPRQFIGSSEIDLAFEKHYRNVIKLPISIELFSVLHEIGHIIADDMDFEDYEEDLEIISKMYNENLIDIDTYISFYTEIPSEASANRWAIAWSKANPNLVKRFEKFMR